MWNPSVRVLDGDTPAERAQCRASLGRSLAAIEPALATDFLPHISSSTVGIDPDDYARLTAELEQLMRVVVRVARQDARRGTLADALGLRDERRALASALAHGPIYGCARFDLLLGSHGPRITEIEAEPDALIARDLVWRAFRRHFPRNFEGDEPNHREHFLEALRRMGADRGPGLILAESCWVDSMPLRLCRALLGEAGLSVDLRPCTDFAAEPEALRRYAWVRTGYFVHSMLPHFPDAMEQLGRVCTWSSLGFSLLGLKSMLARLWTALDDGTLTADESRIVRAYVPRTSMLADLSDEDVLARRVDGVLKPTDDTFGNGVSIGRELSPDAWRQALAGARAEPHRWVVQQRLELPTLDAIDPAGRRERMHFDLCPHLVWLDGDVRWGHRLVRMSRTSLMNLGRSGGFWTFGVIDPRHR